MKELNREKIRIAYLQENNFRIQMKEFVEPYLKKYCRNGWFRGYDGVRLFYYSYIRAGARGSIVISHGFSEFAEKYNELVFYFLQAGYSVFVPEHRGHGSSIRRLKNAEKVYVKSFEEYVWDLRIFVNRIVKRHHKKKAGTEMILFAHSMGGAIGSLYLERYPHDFQKAVLSSPMIRMRIGGIPYSLGMLMAHIGRRAGFGHMYAAGQHGFTKLSCFEHSSSLSRERHLYAFEKRMGNTNYRTSGATISWVSAAGNAADYVRRYKNIEKITIPVLVFAAGREHMVNTDEICRFAAKLKDARLVWLYGAKHEPFNAGDAARRQFYDELFCFLLAAGS